MQSQVHCEKQEAHVYRTGVCFSRHGMLLGTKEMMDNPGFTKPADLFEDTATKTCLRGGHSGLPWA